MMFSQSSIGFRGGCHAFLLIHATVVADSKTSEMVIRRPLITYATRRPPMKRIGDEASCE